AIITITMFMVFLGVLVSFLLRPTAGDYIDKHTVELIRNYLNQSDVCEEKESNAIISPVELELLRNLKKHYIFTYSNIAEVEQDLACNSEAISKMLYFGWALKGSNKKHEEKIKLESFNISITQRSISLSVSNSRHIPPEALKVLDKIEYFKKP